MPYFEYRPGQRWPSFWSRMERLQLQEAAFVASILSCPAVAANLAACTAPALPRCALLDRISLKSDPKHSQLPVRRSWRPVRRACVRSLGPVQRDGHCRSQTALPRPCKIRLSTAALSASSVPPTPPTQTILLALISEYTAPVIVSLHHLASNSQRAYGAVTTCPMATVHDSSAATRSLELPPLA